MPTSRRSHSSRQRGRGLIELKSMDGSAGLL